MATISVVDRFKDFIWTHKELPPPVPSGWSPKVGPIDHSDMERVSPEPVDEDLELEKELGWAEGQTFMITYEDAEGNESQRRITVRNLGLNSENIPVLFSMCHERGAMRAFRLDRVLEVITPDGEVVAPPYPFFVETFGMSPRLAQCEAPKPTSLSRIRLSFTHHLMVLTHLGRVDGDFIPDERAVVLEHCLDIAAKRGFRATTAEETALRRYVKTLKPSKAFLSRSLRSLERDPPEDLCKLLIAANAVIDADGERHSTEEKFFSELREDLVGV